MATVRELSEADHITGLHAASACGPVRDCGLCPRPSVEIPWDTAHALLGLIQNDRRIAAAERREDLRRAIRHAEGITCTDGCHRCPASALDPLDRHTGRHA